MLTPATVLAATAATDQSSLEEVMVTARKRTEKLQDTPVSVTAFSEKSLTSRAIANVGGLAAFVPNLEINNGKGDGGSTNAAIFIRGVGQNDFIFPTDPGVGIYVDGVYIARSIGAMMDLSDVQRIEVLRGPQGTLYGKNTIGGAINVITSQPNDKFGGQARVTTGSRNRIDVDARINVPIVEGKLAFKVAATSKNQDGYVKRPDGTDLGNVNVDAARIGLAWTPTQELRADLSFDISRIRQHGAPGILRGTFSYAGGLYDLYNALAAPMVAARLGLPAGSLFDNRWVDSNGHRSNGTGPTKDDNDTWGTNLTLTWQPDDNLTVKSITAYRKMTAKIQVDMDYSPFPIVHTSEEQHQNQLSQELQFSGKTMNDKLNWLVGGYFLREKARDQNQTLLASGIYDALQALPAALVPLVPGVTCPAVGAPCAGGAGNPFNALFDLDVSPYTALTTHNWAAFAQAGYNVTNQFTVTLGGRYSYEKKRYFIDSIFPNSGKIATPPTEDSKSWSNFTPKVGVDFKVNEDVLLYASFSKGFKSGGWNPRPLSPEEFKGYDPEKLTAYEMGFKSRLLDNRMTFNVATFYSKYKDLQLQTNSVSPTTGGLILTVDNSGSVDLYGFEAEIAARPVQGLDINLGVGYLHNEYKSLAPSVGYSINNKLPQAPEWTLNGGIQYALPLPSNIGVVTLRGDASYRSKTYHDPQNTAAIVQSGYALLDGRVSWDSPDGTWNVAVFVKNITDKYYFSSAEYVPSFGFYNGVVGRPREWGAALSANF
jgi:iron complex outermembrane receptor protein